MRNINFKLSYRRCGQSIAEYTVLFGVIVVATLFATNKFIEAARNKAIAERNEKVGRLLGTNTASNSVDAP